MNCNAPVLYRRICLCAAAVAACALLLPSVQADERVIRLQVRVSTADLDLAQPDAARKLYSRLSKAAYEVCSNPLLVDVPSRTESGSCHERALGNAIRSVDRPQLTSVYLKTHTLQDAAKRGIDVATLMVAN
jgi:UrcA family protein